MPDQSVLRIFVSRPKLINWNGNAVATAIFKNQVEGVVQVKRLNLDGDEQADLTVHGGPDKAVYAYPIEQYEYWKNEMPSRSWDWGSFGENLTVQGFTEHSLHIGDTFSIGTATFAVTQPRMPCFKLGIRLGDPSMVRRFYMSAKWGFYLSVSQEGEIKAGDKMIHQSRDAHDVSLADVSRCFLDRTVDRDLVRKVLNSQLAAQMKEQLIGRFE